MTSAKEEALHQASDLPVPNFTCQSPEVGELNVFKLLTYVIFITAAPTKTIIFSCPIWSKEQNREAVRQLMTSLEHLDPAKPEVNIGLLSFMSP